MYLCWGSNHRDILFNEMFKHANKLNNHLNNHEKVFLCKLINACIKK